MNWTRKYFPFLLSLFLSIYMHLQENEILMNILHEKRGYLETKIN